ncbi:MAG TPA: PTS sugar transporter subunit IIA [Phycisphaerales bacterium]|nr:PTS sugar transporter subunit IIA [Phycisphaerales bacterium]
MKLSLLVADGAIVAQLASKERDDVIRELIDALIAAGAAEPSLRDELVRAVLDRERKGSTGFGKGVAVPHVKHPAVPGMAAAIGLSPGGVDFNALDKQPVYSVFLLLSPEDKPEDHLQAMEVIFKNLSKDTFRRFLRQSSSVADVRTLLEDADNQQIV